GEIAAVAAADNGHRSGIDAGMMRQRVERRDDIAQIVLARDRLELRLGLRVAAQIERQTDASERSRFACARQIPLLAAAPAVYEQTAGDLRAYGDERCGDRLALDLDGPGFIVGPHAA